MFDLDHFKRFNDRHGHEAGNDLLRRVGATLQAVVREADMAARYGGEEFALLISGDAQHGLELAERVRRAIETTALELRGGEVVYVTCQRRRRHLRRRARTTRPRSSSTPTGRCTNRSGAGRNRVTVCTRVRRAARRPAGEPDA